MAKSTNRANRLKIKVLPFDHPAKEILTSAYALNISTMELATMVGVNYSTLNRWMNNKTVPRGEVFYRVMEVQGILRFRMERERGARYPNRGAEVPKVPENYKLPVEARDQIKDILDSIDNV